MGKLDRLRVTRRDDHTRADADFIEQLLRKAKGPDTTLRLPSLPGVMRSPRMAPSTFVAPGKLVQIRHCSAPRRLIARSFEMRCTVPVPMPSDLATLKIPTPFASCCRTFRSVALSIFGRPNALGDGALETCLYPLANHRPLEFSKGAGYS